MPPLRGLGIPHLCEQKSSFSWESTSPLSPGARHPPSLGARHPPSPEAKHSFSPGAKRSPLWNRRPALQRDSILLSSSQGAQHPHRTSPGAAAGAESAARSVPGHSPRLASPRLAGTLRPGTRQRIPSPSQGIPGRGNLRPGIGQRIPQPRVAHPPRRPRAARSPPLPRSSPAAGGPYRSG